METQQPPNARGNGARQARIERGAQVIGTDGPLGAVEQVIVDPDTGHMTNLVVRRGDGREYELPADRIARISGHTVRLDLSQRDLAAHPELARPYNPEMYAGLEEGVPVPPGLVAQDEEETPRVTDIEPDAVEFVTATSLTEPDADQAELAQSEDLVANELTPATTDDGALTTGIVEMGVPPTELAVPLDETPVLAKPADKRARRAVSDLETSGPDLAASAALATPAEDLGAVDLAGTDTLAADLTDADLTGADLADGEAITVVELAEPLDAPLPPADEPLVPPRLATPSPVAPRATVWTAELDTAGWTRLVAAGILVGTAAAGATYLLVRRRQRLQARQAQAMARLDAVRGLSRSAWDSVRSAGSNGGSRLATRAATTRDQARAWVPAAALTAAALRERVASGLGDLSTAARAQAENVSGQVSSALPRPDQLASGGAMASGLASGLAAGASASWQRARDRAANLGDAAAALWDQMSAQDLGDRASALADRANQLGGQMGTAVTTLGDRLRGAWNAMPSVPPISLPRLALPRLTMPRPALPRWRAAQTATAANVGAAKAATSNVRRAAARGTRTVTQRVRWFRRGLYAGFVFGFFYAPEAGTDARARLSATLRRVPWLGERLESERLGTVRHAAGGPHPREDLPSGSALARAGMPSSPSLRSPLLQPTSEEELAPPSTQEIGGEMPSAPGL